MFYGSCTSRVVFYWSCKVFMGRVGLQKCFVGCVSKVFCGLCRKIGFYLHALKTHLFNNYF